MMRVEYKNLGFKRDEELIKEEEEFLLLFKKCVGKPRSLQKFWIRRIVNGESFSLVSPTGVGKTTFGLIASIYFLKKNKKSYILVPTTLLVSQSVERLKNFLNTLGIDGNVTFYHGKLKKEDKERAKEIIKSGKFDILITTTQFLSENFSLLYDKLIDFIFVDDVDSILKRSRNIDKILLLMGFRKRGNEWYGKRKAILIVSTATAKKGRATSLFRKLLNFDVGSTFLTIRNIEDIFVEDGDIQDIEDILNLMGGGGIIYAKDLKEVERYYEILKEIFKIGIITNRKKSDYERFKNGEIDYLIGTTHYYGLLVRGLDIPERIKYVVFTSAPVLRVKYDELTPKLVKILSLSLRSDERIKRFLPYIPFIEKNRKIFEELREIIKEISKESKAEDIVLTENEVVFPDIRTYIQASGRASRLTVNGMIKGASFLFEEDKKVLNAFIKRAEYFDIEFKKFNSVDIEKLKEDIERSRRERSIEEEIKPALFIVESPTKAKTIARFFGKPGIRVFGNSIVYEIPTERFVLLITASIGHVVDLSTEGGFFGAKVDGEFIPIYSSIKRCRRCGYQFTKEVNYCPKCGSKEIDDAKERINVLRKISHEAGYVIIGTDPDSEGEKISWDIKNLIGNNVYIKRAEFHEVTPKAIKEALSNLRDINENLVKAQIVRRIEDRWIGFSLTQKLWEAFKTKNLSAGRVQTPVLGWIIDAYEKYRNRKYFTVIPELGVEIEGKLTEKGEIDVEITLLYERSEKKKPLPPYTTDEMLKDANRILGFSTKETMKIAQDLFESGLITYHRTDSIYVSDRGLKIQRIFLVRILKEEDGEKLVPMSA